MFRALPYASEERLGRPLKNTPHPLVPRGLSPPGARRKPSFLVESRETPSPRAGERVGVSNCLRCQEGSGHYTMAEVVGAHRVWCLSRALMMVSSLCMQAVRATFFV